MSDINVTFSELHALVYATFQKRAQGQKSICSTDQILNSYNRSCLSVQPPVSLWIYINIGILVFSNDSAEITINFIFDIIFFLISINNVYQTIFLFSSCRIPLYCFTKLIEVYCNKLFFINHCSILLVSTYN